MNKGNIPEDTMRALIRYVKDGIRAGHFLTSVLENNLFEAVARADHDNKIGLFDLVTFIYNECPIACHGSRDTVDAWLSPDNAMRRESISTRLPWLRS